mgnify:CR=1 FL=1
MNRQDTGGEKCTSPSLFFRCVEGGLVMRFTVLLLSMGTVVLFGYALAGLGGYFFARGRPDYIVFGLAGGILTAAVALFLWKKYLVTLENETGKDTMKNV